MTKITQADINLLIKLFKMKDYELHDYLHNKLAKVYGVNKLVNKKGKYLVAVGSKVGLVAHLDVVGDIPPNNIVYNKKYITAIDSILGADDRVGVFIILKMLERGFKPTIIFTHDEEKGCIGATDFTYDFEDIGVNYLIQLDRRGGGVVFYDNDNQEFLEYVLSFRNKEEFGSFSDISILCPNCNVSGCNLGVGYFNEHTKGEYQDLDILADTIDVVDRMLQDENNSKYYEYQAYLYTAYDYDYEGQNQTMVNYNGRWVTLQEYYEILYGVTEEEIESSDDIPYEKENVHDTKEEIPF